MTKQPKNYAFIDSQNLYKGIKSQGWEMDLSKFRLYLKNKFNVSHAYIFIGFIPRNQALYQRLQQVGFVLIFKPIIKYYENGKWTVKGNVDAELVLHAAAIEFSNYDKAVIASNDGDFACLIDFLHKNKKLLNILTPNEKYSKLLKPFSEYIMDLGGAKNSLETKKTGISGRSKP